MKDRRHFSKTRIHPLAPGAEDGGGEEFDPRNPLWSFPRAAGSVLIAPRRFFAGLDPHGPARRALLFALSCSVLSYLLEAMAGPALATALAGPGASPAGAGLSLSGALARPSLSMLVLFVSAAVVHLLARAFLTRELGFGATLRVACYAGATGLLAWLPIVGGLTPFYWLCLIVLGLRALHESALEEAEREEAERDA